MESTDVIIIGAGVGGLTAGALLAKDGYQVIVYEASNEYGGSASKFDRHGFRFAAGATLGMGFQKDGVFDKLFRALNRPLPEAKLLDLVMDVHVAGRTIHYYRNPEAWRLEIARVFPEEKTKALAFFEEVLAAGKLFDAIVEYRPFIPPSTGSDWLYLLRFLRPSLLKYAPWLLQTVADRLSAYGIALDSPFAVFLNGQLMDSVQTTAETCPALVGMIALSVFHQGAYTVKGGLAALSEALAASIIMTEGKVKKREAIKRVSRYDGLWQVETVRGELCTAKHIVFNSSMHNVFELLDGTEHKKLKVRKAKESNRLAWGAFTLYLGLEDTHEARNAFCGADRQWTPFQQLIKEQDKPLAEGNQFLVSWLDHAEGSLGPTITISTHTMPEPWWKREDYEQKKEQLSNLMLDTLFNQFPMLKKHVVMQFVGTPVTFQRYLHRKLGKVGGYIPLGKSFLLDMYSPRLGPKGLWMVGDTVFPGAGTPGAALSGWTVAEAITQKKSKY